MHLISIDASPKQLSKLRNGHKVRIKQGTGFNLIVKPDTYHRVSRTFSQAKGVDIALSPEEIDANKMYSPERHAEIADEMSKVGASPPMEGQGIFKKAGRWLKKAGKRVAKAATGKVVSSAIKYAVPALATALLGPAGAPIGALVGDVAAKHAGSAAEKAVGKKMGVGMYSGAGMRVPRELSHAGIGTYEASKAMKKLQDMQYSQRHHIAPNEDYYNEPLGPRSRGTGAYQGGGLYAGRGLYAGGGMFGGQLDEVSSVGRNGGFTRHLPPALQSQPYSANFHFQFQLPPQYQQYEQGPAVEY